MIARLLAAFLLLCVSLAHAGTIIPQQSVIYKSAAAPLPQQKQAKWLPPANAYTAVTVPANFELLHPAGATIAQATVVIVWRANSPSANVAAGLMLCPSQANAGVELVGCGLLAYFAANDAGPASYTPGCSANPGGVFPCRIDVTANLQNALNTGWPSLYYTGVAYGNGSTGPDIYAIELYINWSIP